MLKSLSLPAALLAALAIAAPAGAQDPSTDTTQAPVCSGVGENGTANCTPGDQAQTQDQDQTIGDGQVVTDPADEVDGPTVPSDGDGQDQADDQPNTPKQGESHVLGETASSSDQPAATSQPVAQPAPAATSSRKTLPFTGVDALPLVEMGVALLLMGWLLRRRLEAS